ncbi:GcrA family cell cycle regulator [Phenylobacterium sp. J426]|uniref:GcrA family cell cycle regulator n=1 Tax=Phenylobacterium sp. J426 TaxID=2898439 RepID=UPI0035B05DD0
MARFIGWGSPASARAARRPPGLGAPPDRPLSADGQARRSIRRNACATIPWQEPRSETRPGCAPASGAHPDRAEPGPGLAATLDQLPPGACRWPIGDPKAADFSFCGRPAGVLSYCPFHWRRAHAPPSSSRFRRRRASPGRS